MPHLSLLTAENTDKTKYKKPLTCQSCYLKICTKKPKQTFLFIIKTPALRLRDFSKLQTPETKNNYFKRYVFFHELLKNYD